MAIVNAGYMGVCSIQDEFFRCSTFDVGYKQSSEFYDHVLGLRDVLPGGVFSADTTKSTYNEPFPVFNPQRIFWRRTKGIVDGSFSMPLVDDKQFSWFEWARTGQYLPAFYFLYYCNGVARGFNKCRVDNYDLKLEAGDYAVETVGVVGAEIIENDSIQNGPSYTTAEKLVTWDKSTIAITGLQELDLKITSFNLKINNNCKPVWTSGRNNNLDNVRKLLPYDIRVGMQEVTGDISFYNKGTSLNTVNGIYQISVTIGTRSFVINALFEPVSRSGMIGPITSTLSFTGVDYALGVPSI